jgi:aspartate aminotransferase
VAAPVQYAALAAYAADPAIAQHIAQSARLHGARTRVLHSVLQEFGVPCPLPDAGFYLYPNFERWRAVLAQRNVHTSAQLAAHLLEKHSIATLPGSAFQDNALTLRLSSSYLDTEQPAGGAEVFAAFARDADDCIIHAHPRLQRAAAALAEFISGLGS